MLFITSSSFGRKFPPLDPCKHYLGSFISSGYGCLLLTAENKNRIDDMSKLATRREMPHHQTIAKAFEEEDLLSEPLGYSLLEEKGAWVR